MFTEVLENNTRWFYPWAIPLWGKLFMGGLAARDLCDGGYRRLWAMVVGV